MEPMSDMLQGELERLFDLDAIMEISSQLLGFDPTDIGSSASKGAFARALVARCEKEDALPALADAILLSSTQADPSLRKLATPRANGELKPGTHVGGMRVIKKLSEGNLQVVYLAEAGGETGKRVALRVVRQEYATDKAATRRFTTVSRLLQSLQSPGLAPVVNVGVLDDERPWVAAELVEGQTLAARIERTGCLHFNEARLIFNDVLDALKALHDRGLVHGDVATDNVFVARKATASGSGSESHGVLVGGGTDRLLTRRHGGATGVLPLLATAKATSPEQARGLEIDARSDVYALGVLMYEVLAGRPPFVGDSVIEVIAQHLNAIPEPPSTHAKRGWVPKELDDIVLRALEKDPASRFQSAQGLLEALSRMGRASMRPQQIDKAAFRDAVGALLQRPGDVALASTVEELAEAAGAWTEAAEAFNQVIAASTDDTAKLGLLFRLARIYEGEIKDGLRAEATYQRILELDSDNEVARSGIETARRERGDGEGLIEVLLEKVERQSSQIARAETMAEIAQVYERQMNDNGNAFVAWLQALTEHPSDERALREVERLSGSSEERWGEAVNALSEATQQIQALLTEEPAPVVVAPTVAPGAHEQEMLAVAQQAHDFHRQNLTMAELHLEEASTQLEALVRQAEEKAAAVALAHEEAEAVVERYEAISRALEEAPEDEDLQMTAAQLAQDAETAVDSATAAEEEGAALNEQLATLRASLTEIEGNVDQARHCVKLADETLDNARANLELALGAEMETPAALGDDDIEAQAANLVRLYVIMGRWYAERLSRPDFALSCFSQALTIDPGNESAYDATIDLYRMAQAWGDLATMLLQRAERTQNPVRARDYRAEAAEVIAQMLGDAATARFHFEAILAEDPGHPAAQQHLEEILVAQEDWAGVAAVIERRLESTAGAERVALLNRLGELYEDRLDDLDRAIEAYRATLQVEARDLTALKGLERIYARNGAYKDLMEALKAQVELAATPKQRMGLLERIGALQEEEFLDAAAATETFEAIIALDPAHNAANVALVRLYRQLRRFSDVVTTLERHASHTNDDERKVDLLLTAVRTLMVEIGAPDRAMEICERVLRIEESQPEALDQLAKLKSTAGDVSAAVEAVERLAEAEQDPKKRADLWIRAATLLEERGDHDGAIDHYKTALDTDRTAALAIDGLSRIYTKRGDAHGAIEMLLRHIDVAEGDNKRAELYAEIGRLCLDRLRDHERAREALETALELDPTCIAASIGLGQMEFEAENFRTATQYFESPLGHLDQMPQAQALRLCQLAGEAYRELKDYARARETFERARGLDGSLKAHEQVAKLVLEAGEAKDAERLYFEIVRKFADKVEAAERGRLLMLHGRAQLAAGSAKKAVETIKLAAEQRPHDKEVLAALTEAYVGARDWKEAISLLQLRTRTVANEGEKFDLLVQIGDVFLEKLRDREAASQTYVSALEIKPDDRNLLTKLMAVYSDGKDWARLIEVILRIAEMVSDTAQLAKYYNTAATIAHNELGRNDEAANYYDEALSHDASLGAAFNGLVQCLTQNQDWDRLERAYETRADRIRNTASKTEIARLLDARGEVLQFRLGRVGDAIRVYEAAQEIDPDNRSRREMLTDIYTKEPKRFFQRAVQSHRELLAQNPFRIESYQALRKIYTSAKKPDESWCVCQALRVLNMADPEEEKFYKKYRLSKLAKTKQSMTDELWRELVVHPEQDQALTQILAIVTPAAMAAQAQTLRALGIDERNRANPATDPTAIGRMMEYVAESTGIRLPPVYHRPQDQGGVSFLFVSPPAIGIGQAAAAGGPQQALAFVAGRHLSYYRGGHFMRRMVPTGTGLRAWLMAAIRTVNPRFPVPASMEPHIKEALAAIKTHLSGPQRDSLRSVTQKLLEAAPELDLKRWVAGVDYTADRVGFILSNDLKIAQAVIEASPEDSAAVSRKDRAQELLRYSVSETYFELRHRLGIALGG